MAKLTVLTAELGAQHVFHVLLEEMLLPQALQHTPQLLLIIGEAALGCVLLPFSPLHWASGDQRLGSAAHSFTQTILMLRLDELHLQEDKEDPLLHLFNSLTITSMSSQHPMFVHADFPQRAGIAYS